MLRTIFRLAPVALLSGSIAFAQQAPPQTPDAGPGHGPATPGQPAPPQPPNPRADMMRDRGREMRDSMQQQRPHDIQIITAGGMRGDSRIAPPGIWWKNPELVQRLSLSAEQQKRMDDIFQNSRIQLIDLKANVEKQEVTLDPLLDANPVDAKKVLAQIGRLADARAELEKGNAAMLLAIRGVLTPDQWTKLHADDRGHRRITVGDLGQGSNGFDLALLNGGNPSGLPESFTIEIPDVQNELKNLDLKGLEEQMKGVRNSLNGMVIRVPKIDMEQIQKSLDTMKLTMPKIDMEQLQRSLDSVKAPEMIITVPAEEASPAPRP